MAILFLIVFGVALLNMAGAGAAALLAIKARGTSRWRRTVWACAMTGAVTALIFAGFVLGENLASGESAVVLSAVLAIFILVSAVVSLPGAMVMSRLAERGPDVGDTFA